MIMAFSNMLMVFGWIGLFPAYVELFVVAREKFASCFHRRASGRSAASWSLGVFRRDDASAG
jgi:hypothetical protein|tara:strand:+ start:572 stop:757 length:186 start_codon:yes stop_codon:yes gene_type:complete